MLTIGMTANEVIEVIGPALDITIDIWDGDLGAAPGSTRTWYYKPNVLARDFANPLVDSLLFLSEDNILVGWDISRHRQLPVLMGNKDETFIHSVAIGDTKPTVIQTLGTPDVVIPASWNNYTNPEIWRYKDDDNNVIKIIEFKAGMVSAIR